MANNNKKQFPLTNKENCIIYVELFHHVNYVWIDTKFTMKKQRKF